MENHYYDQIKEINVRFSYKLYLLEVDHKSEDSAYWYVRNRQISLDHLMALRNVMLTLPWEEQVEFCRASNYGDSLLHYLDKNQQLAYKLTA